MLMDPLMSDVKANPESTEPEESVDHYQARISRHSSFPAASEVVAGAATGALFGAMAGPFGMLAGGIVGGAVGAISGATLAQDDVRRAQHQAELDEDIGVTKGDLGASARQRRSAPDGAEANTADDAMSLELSDLD